MRWKASEPLAFEAELVHRAGESFYLYVPFSFDGLLPTITIGTREFTLPNVETLTEVLFRLASDALSWSIQMVSGDEVTVATLFSNFVNDEISIDGFNWIDGKPFDRDCILKYAFAGNQYEVIGGSGSPGADDNGYSLVCQLRTHMWIYASDPGEWHDLGEVSRDAAIEYFHNDYEFMWANPNQYEYSEWFAN